MTSQDRRPSLKFEYKMVCGPYKQEVVIPPPVCVIPLGFAPTSLFCTLELFSTPITSAF